MSFGTHTSRTKTVSPDAGLPLSGHGTNGHRQHARRCWQRSRRKAHPNGRTLISMWLTSQNRNLPITTDVRASQPSRRRWLLYSTCKRRYGTWGARGGGYETRHHSPTSRSNHPVVLWRSQKTQKIRFFAKIRTFSGTHNGLLNYLCIVFRKGLNENNVPHSD